MPTIRTRDTSIAASLSALNANCTCPTFAFVVFSVTPFGRPTALTSIGPLKPSRRLDRHSALSGLPRVRLSASLSERIAKSGFGGARRMR